MVLDQYTYETKPEQLLVPWILFYLGFWMWGVVYLKGHGKGNVI